MKQLCFIASLLVFCRFLTPDTHLFSLVRKTRETAK
jgi:hypothetical protein